MVVREFYMVFNEENNKLIGGSFMKTFKNMDLVQLATLAGSVLTIAGTMISGYANGKKLDETIDTKVAEAIAKHLANQTSNE